MIYLVSLIVSIFFIDFAQCSYVWRGFGVTGSHDMEAIEGKLFHTIKYIIKHILISHFFSLSHLSCVEIISGNILFGFRASSPYCLEAFGKIHVKPRCKWSPNGTRTKIQLKKMCLICSVHDNILAPHDMKTAINICFLSIIWMLIVFSVSPVKVGENELLPLLLDELPHLHVSPHALERMWQQQMQQVDRLHAVSLPQRRSKLSKEVGTSLVRYNQSDLQVAAKFFASPASTCVPF